MEKYNYTYENPTTGQEYYTNKEAYPTDDSSEFIANVVDGLGGEWKIFMVANENWDGVNSEDASDWNVIRAEWAGEVDYKVIKESDQLLTVKGKYADGKTVVIDKGTWNGECYFEAGQSFYPCYNINENGDAEVVGYRESL